jgi:hypothetical protein
VVAFVSAISLLLLLSILLGLPLFSDATAQQRNFNSSSSTLPPVPDICKMQNQGLPDPKCTPGTINPSVTQNNIKNTICVPGWTRTVRPPLSYTAPLKIKLMQSYGFTDSRSNYELDHLIPLEVGGNPTSVDNLWPEPGYGQYNYKLKDSFENYLKSQVCSGSMSLSKAQGEIASNWIANLPQNEAGFIAGMIPLPSTTTLQAQGVIDEGDNATIAQ